MESIDVALPFSKGQSAEKTVATDQILVDEDCPINQTLLPCDVVSVDAIDMSGKHEVDLDTNTQKLSIESIDSVVVGTNNVLSEKERIEAVNDTFTASNTTIAVIEHVADTTMILSEKGKAKAVSFNDDDSDSNDGKEDSDDEGAKVTELLQQKQLEDSDRVRQLITSRVQKPESDDQFELLVRHSQTVTALALADDDLTGFSASKDGSIIQWDVESGTVGKYMWPSKEILSLHGAKNPQNSAKKGSKHVLSIAVSSDGRYLATGGLDRHVHLWDTRTRQHIQAFPGHRGPVSCLTFRQGSSQLISGACDRQIKLWNVEDRAYMDTLFGHQGERVLSVGCDRSMRLFKIAEESQLVFRASAASLECCCFISNDEFLSGSDDMKSVGYVYMYFLRGSLPWQGLKAATKTEKYEKIFKNKLSNSNELLCKPHPVEFVLHFHYCHSLSFDQQPDYGFLIQTMSTTLEYYLTAVRNWNSFQVMSMVYCGIKRIGRLAYQKLRSLAGSQYPFFTLWLIMKAGDKLNGILSLGALESGEYMKYGTAIAPGLYAPKRKKERWSKHKTAKCTSN
ncbi:hypothetical protein MKW94_018772 [Papaver nudicaule]|uniref:Uncharacterized protein n=1 Tax=Papaver nudicaule TaxID=74823 RepID=A0AA41VSN1_PAPNU|nr:hypothetical protein [Papaver nudicaule]